MQETEHDARNQMAELCASLYARGFSVGAAGNVPVRLEDGILMTPANATLGGIHPEEIAKTDRSGNHVSGGQPAKEVFLHQAFYETWPQAGVVVHQHSTWATALSYLEDTDPDDCIPR